MYQNYKKSLKQSAINLRRKGLSYSEIQKQIRVSKSTLSYWFKNVKLTRSQLAHLNQKRIEAGKIGAKRKHESARKSIEEIRKTSAKAIKEISPRELWLMGIVLYWRERFRHGNNSDSKKGVHFTSSDPYIIRLFLKWLLEVGKLDKKEIAFDLFISVDKKNRLLGIVEYWVKVTGFPKKSFKNTYFFKPRKAPKIRVIHNKSNKGLLRIRVKASSMFARQLAGWIKGIQKYYWND